MNCVDQINKARPVQILQVLNVKVDENVVDLAVGMGQDDYALDII